MKYCRFIAFLTASILASGAPPAAAKWHEASSAHFVIYADDLPADIQRFSEQLERYHMAMNFVTNGSFPDPSPSNRVTVYTVKNDAEVRKLAGADSSRWLGGFYIARAGGSLAIIPEVNSARGETNGAMLTLLHEYAHHFIKSTNQIGLPRWVNEGSAEFFASAKFDNDGGVSLGRPAFHRAAELNFAADVTARDLLDPAAYEKRKRGNNYDAYYGKSWLLFHYLRFNAPRKGQLGTYLDLLQKGLPLAEAGQKAFGDFDVLEKELDRYQNAPRMTIYQIKPESIPIGQVTVRPLRDGEAAMMPVIIRSKRGVNREAAQPIVIDARAIAAQYPDDPAVLSALAEAEYDAGNSQAAVAAADRALAIDSGQVNAYVQKGYALFRIAEEADDPVAAYRAALKPFIALNKIENDHPIPLIYFYRSFLAQHIPPTPLAISGLEQAVGLAPFDRAARFALARQYLRDNRLPEARQNLAIIAFDPHAGGMGETAQKLIDKIDAKQISPSDGDESAEPDSSDG